MLNNKNYFLNGDHHDLIIKKIDNNQTSQELAISTNTNNDDNELHWCPDLDYHLSCDNMYKTPNTGVNDCSQISFTMANSDINSNQSNNQQEKLLPFMNMNNNNSNHSKNNFDIHLAQIDIETFKSEDIKRIPFNQSMNMSNDDTLRIVDSISSFTTNNHLSVPNEDCEALSIDSLDISVDNEINSELIQKCAENDRTKYKIAMIESQLNNSQLMLLNNNNPFNLSEHSNNNNNLNESQTLQSPGSLVKMFIQNKNSAENSSNNLNNLLFDSKNDNNNNNGNSQNNEINSFTTEDNRSIDESTGNSLNTIDSNELPLHVLDLSKKLRSLNLNNNSNNNNNSNKQMKQCSFSTSVSSSNTSFLSTTTSSSATYDKRKHSNNTTNNNKMRLQNNNDNNNNNSTNPFLNHCKEENKITKSAGTQFPDVFQDKEVQASLEDSITTPLKDAPVLVYYPNYSLPDLSFLQEIFNQDNKNRKTEHHHPVYLSPVKHEPVKVNNNVDNPVRLRTNNNCNDNNGQRKCRPKSYTDYETILNQDLSHIKDWDSLNLLLPDDFKEFIEQNNLNLKFNNNEHHINQDKDLNFEQLRRNSGIIPPPPPSGSSFIPMKAMNHRLFKDVKLRPHSMRTQDSQTKRYSLQEHYMDQNHINNNNYYNNFNNNNNYYPNPNHLEFMNNHEPPPPASLNSFMIRSQTMPNCQMAFAAANPHIGNCYGHLAQAPPPIPPRYHNCCCHSGCHSPSSTLHSSQQSSPQKTNLNFQDLISSSNSFKKLLSFLSKLDEYSSHSDSTNNTEVPDNPVMPRPERKANNTKHRDFPTTSNNTDVDPTPTRSNNSKTYKSSYRPSSNNKNNNLEKNRNHHNRPNNHQVSQGRQKSAQIQTTATTTKNSSNDNKTKIILKRPTSLNKSSSNHQNSTTTNIQTGIPLPKRLSSGIPVLHKNNTQQSTTNNSMQQNQNSARNYHHSRNGNNNTSNRF